MTLTLVALIFLLSFTVLDVYNDIRKQKQLNQDFKEYFRLRQEELLNQKEVSFGTFEGPITETEFQEQFDLNLKILTAELLVPHKEE